ncbi:MAG: SUMF1/EgtB/PvdO family nonheme iron enzyme [Candidatus Hatepunaea meridiana]|nr:SUMF1/EgtB/PvdO family nonheme iron enzyme [Candidatus Hatepunaea meridiana]
MTGAARIVKRFFPCLCFLISILLIFSCSEEILWDNPVDPDNPVTSGDPYQLEAEIADGGAKLTWQAVNISSITGYNIYRKDNDSTFNQLQQVNATTLTHTDTTIQNGHRYEYYVVAHTATEEGEASNVARVAVSTDPVIFIERESDTLTPTRNVTLTVIAFGAQKMLLSNNVDFSRAEWEVFTSTKSWELSNGDGWKNVYIRIITVDGDTSSQVSDSIGLDTYASISSFTWSSTGGDTLVPDDRVMFTVQTADDEFGTETGGRAVVTVEGWTGIELVGQANGSYTSSYTITPETPEVSNAHVVVSFTDRAGNEVSNESNRRLTADWLSAGDERNFPLGDSGESISMCWIPAGSFMMGRQDGEQDSDSDESPRHRVTLTEGFWMGKYEVTQAQWEAVMGSNPSSFKGTNRPIEQVTWNEIQEFESELDNEFRLPSESEWEYACRAGTTTRFYWGDDPDYGDMEYYSIYYICDTDDHVETSEVGTKAPNAWGLYDMSGNVWEWCEDDWHDDYYGAPVDGSAWIEDPRKANTVLRGGSYNCNLLFFSLGDYRSASRRLIHYLTYGRIIGFRLVRF